jgi:SAM-dependent methyltransferase
LNRNYEKIIDANKRDVEERIKNMKKDERYISTVPSTQNAVDLFKDSWSSCLPLDNVKSGSIPLFDDPRIRAFNSVISVAGKTILELGPLEGAHSKMLQDLGAASVTSVESNSISFLKCLTVKNIFQLNTSFLLGDFREYIKECKIKNIKYDIVLASGVLYHMTNPVELLRDISDVTEVVYIWTHYYSKTRTDTHKRFDKKPVLLDSQYSAYKHYYRKALKLKGFCGGTLPYSLWLERDALLEGLQNVGFKSIEILNEGFDHPSGNEISLVASKKSSKT